MSKPQIQLPQPQIHPLFRQMKTDEAWRRLEIALADPKEYWAISDDRLQPGSKLIAGVKPRMSNIQRMVGWNGDFTQPVSLQPAPKIMNRQAMDLFRARDIETERDGAWLHAILKGKNPEKETVALHARVHESDRELIRTLVELCVGHTSRIATPLPADLEFHTKGSDLYLGETMVAQNAMWRDDQISGYGQNAGIVFKASEKTYHVAMRVQWGMRLETVDHAWSMNNNCTKLRASLKEALDILSLQNTEDAETGMRWEQGDLILPMATLTGARDELELTPEQVRQMVHHMQRQEETGLETRKTIPREVGFEVQSRGGVKGQLLASPISAYITMGDVSKEPVIHAYAEGGKVNLRSLLQGMLKKRPQK